MHMTGKDLNASRSKSPKKRPMTQFATMSSVSRRPKFGTSQKMQLTMDQAAGSRNQHFGDSTNSQYMEEVQLNWASPATKEGKNITIDLIDEDVEVHRGGSLFRRKPNAQTEVSMSSAVPAEGS